MDRNTWCLYLLLMVLLQVESGLEDEDPWATEEKVGIIIFTIR